MPARYVETPRVTRRPLARAVSAVALAHADGASIYSCARITGGARRSTQPALDGCGRIRHTEPVGEREVVEDLVRRLLAAAPTMYLSTTANDEPWGAGTFFAESDLFHLSVVLEAHGRTLNNIRRNPRVAMVVSSGNPFEPFLQGAADAELLDGGDNLKATTDALRTKAPQIEPLLSVPMVAVQLHVRRWRATDVVNGWLPAKEIAASEASSA